MLWRVVVLYICWILGADSVAWATVRSASLISSLPALILLLLAQRQVKSGIALGSGK